MASSDDVERSGEMAFPVSIGDYLAPGVVIVMAVYLDVGLADVMLLAHTRDASVRSEHIEMLDCGGLLEGDRGHGG